jgi:WD40 repeat protein
MKAAKLLSLNGVPTQIPPTQPTQNPNAGIPKTARMLATLPHNDIVCAVAVNGETNQVFTGGKGSVKLWDLNASTNKPMAEMKCLPNAYIRSCKLANRNNSLIVAGETNVIALWDLAQGGPRLKSTLPSPAQGYAVSVHDEEHTFYTCYSDGTIGAWDLKSGTQTKKFVGHTDGVSCIDMSPDGQKLITGGLDCTIRVWDINTTKELAAYSFPSQIFSVGICPGESWVAIGLANSHVEVVNLLNSNCKYQLHLHESCVLSLKFANTGKWFITTGKDKLLNSWRSPFGASIFQCREPNSILCSDISADDRLIVTGSGEQLATVYDVIY